MSKPKASKNALSRLRADYMRLKKDPVPYIEAEPLPSNILEWYYVVKGPPNSAYEGGYYVGKLIFSREYPFKPPSIYIITPNGRFKTQTRICLSISDFHPDTWNPAWNVSTILTGLLSFMLEKSPTLGSIETTDYEKGALALQSLEYNLRIPHFCDLFPNLAETFQKEIAERKQAEEQMNKIIQSNPTLMHNVNSLLTASNSKDGTSGEMQDVEHGRLYSFLMNIFVFLGFAMFAFTVKYVILNIS